MTDIDWNAPFCAEDFNLAKATFWNDNDPVAANRLTPILQEALAEIANARFCELVSEHGKRVYSRQTEWGGIQYGQWLIEEEILREDNANAAIAHTHTAVLIMEEEIK